MKNLINKFATVRNIFIFFIPAIVFYIIMLTITIPRVMSFSGGMQILDMLPAGYNVEYVHSLLNILGEEGRFSYLYNQIPFDMIFPFLLGFGFCLIFAYIVKKHQKQESTLFYLCILPLFSGLFDYCENIGIIIMLKMYPVVSNILAQVTSIFSILKSFLTVIWIFILCILFILLAIRKFIIKSV